MGSEECMSGKAIYQNFMDGRGTDPLMDSQRSIGTVSDFYEERVSQIKRLAVSMEEGWTGDASGAAQRGAGPLAQAHARASVEMKTTKDLLSRQSESYGVAHANVVDVPDMPKEPSLFKKVVTLGGASDSYEDKVEASNAANQRNIEVMRNWADASSVNGAMMPTDYGNISTKDVTVGVTEEPVVPPIRKKKKWPPDPVTPPEHVNREEEGGIDKKGVDNGDDKKVGTDDDKLGPDEKVVRPPVPDRPIRLDELPPPPINDDWRNTFPDQTDKPDTVKPPTSGGKDELTRPEDFTPEKPGDRPGWNLPGGPGGTGGTGGTSGAGQGSSGGSGFGPFGGLGGSGSGSGAGSGSGSGRFGSGGSGTGGASGLGGEKSLGGRGVGSASGAAEAMGRGGVAGGKGMGAGAAGRPGGAGGMPGMGAGQRGQGDEDEEHQRKYIVDDDEAFQLTDDGERLTDPRTGMPLTPPVIGE